jgi:predicted MarR family transcription regulator
MSHAMSQMQETANAHMRRDVDAVGKWRCRCEACHGIRSLVGLEKMLAIRPLVRDLERSEEQLSVLPDGPERQILLAANLKLHDILAAAMTR